MSTTLDGGEMLRTNVFPSDEPELWDHVGHLQHELLWSLSGAVNVEVDGRFWLVPPTLAVWIPAGTPHVVRADAGSITCATFVDPTAVCTGWHDRVTGVSMHAALRELLRYAYNTPLERDERRRLHRVAIDLLQPIVTAPIELPLPSTAGLRQVADHVVQDPADDRTTEEWAARLSMSGRTFTRAFVRETGMSFTQWRLRARVRAGLAELGAGHGVVAVAHRLGYSNPSTFIDACRRLTGQTPAAYVRRVDPPVEDVEKPGSASESRS